MIAAHTIQLGINDVVVSGGMESMSNTPKYLQEVRLSFSPLPLFKLLQEVVPMFADISFFLLLPS